MVSEEIAVASFERCDALAILASPQALSDGGG